MINDIFFFIFGPSDDNMNSNKNNRYFKDFSFHIKIDFM